MTTRMRRLTAIGLPARDELLVRSLLQVVNAKTTEAWAFHEGLEANVALCNPDSALSMMAIKRASSHGLVCVSVVHEGGRTLPETLTLRAPIRSGDFIEMLNEASGRLQLGGRPRRAVAVEAEPGESLALALRRYGTQAESCHLRMDVDGRSWVAALKTRRLGGADALGDNELLTLGLSRSFRVDILDEAAGEAALATASWVGGLERLWWLSGQHLATHGGAAVSDSGSYQLRRWPDAGRLSLQPYQLRMAAVLARQALTPGELAAMVGRPLGDAQAFLGGCAMLGLLSEAATPSASMDMAPPPVPRASRYSELFQSLRAVLGIRS